MTNQLERQNFYMGQSVTPEQLNVLQDYSDRGQDQLITSLLGYGVVYGFEVRHLEGHIIEITPGIAYGSNGQKLLLDSNKQVNLISEAPNSGERTIKLGIKLDYLKENPVLDSLGNTEYTKWSPTVKFVMGENLENTSLELVEIILNALDVVSIKPIAKEFINLPKQIQQTSAFNTIDNSATIESSIVNIITSNLQVNGRDLMEIGRNSNGTYVKFENGLLICFSPVLNTRVLGSNLNNTAWVLPYQFVSSPNVIAHTVSGIGYHNMCAGVGHSNNTTAATLSFWISYPGENRVNQCKGTAIGFWK